MLGRILATCAIVAVLLSVVAPSPALTAPSCSKNPRHPDCVPTPTATPTATPTPTPTPPPTDCTVTLNPGASVQAAIDAAAAGSIICLNDGLYSGFRVTKALTIRGGHIRQALPRVIDVVASGVTLDGVEVSGAFLQDNPFYGAGVRFIDVSSGTIRNCFLHDNTAYGIDLTRANNITVAGCEITNSGAGIWVQQSTGYDIVGNDIHDITLPVRNNTTNPDDDYGGQCISLHTALGPGLIRDNLIHTCRTDSFDYGPNGMGPGIEVYQSGGFVARGNTFWDVVNAFESGTKTDTLEQPFRFEYNVVYGTIGPLLILRSNPGTVIEHNTFDGNADGLMLQHQGPGQYSTTIDNVIIRNNLFTNNPNKAFRFDTDPPASLVIDYNGYWNNGRMEWDWGTFAQWQAGTPYDDHSLLADPLYVDRLGHDYHLQPGSPMLGRGHDGSDIGAFGVEGASRP